MCPQCNTVSLDQDEICGVCGAYVGKASSESTQDALSYAEKVESQLEAEATEHDYLEPRKNLLAYSTLRLLVGPVFAIVGFLGYVEYATSTGIQTNTFASYAVMMLIGFAGIIHDVQGRDDPPFGWVKPYWILVKMWLRSRYPQETHPKTDSAKIKRKA